MFLPRPVLWVRVEGPLPCELLLTDRDKIQDMEPCAFRQAQRDAIRQLPRYAVAIARLPRPKVKYARKKPNGDFGWTAFDKPQEVKVYLTGDATEDFDSINHEMLHSIFFRLKLAAFEQIFINTWVDTRDPAWVRESLLWSQPQAAPDSQPTGLQKEKK